MTQSSQTNNTLAPLRNVLAFRTMLQRLDDRSAGLAGMGCFYGPAGFGKTMASIYCANQRGACLVQCESTWTVKTLCQVILEELGIKPARTTPEMSRQIQQALAMENIPLIVDEADYLVTKKSVEILRDIYEKSGVPVILVGEEALPAKLRQWERIHSRMLERVAAEPLDDEDFGHLKRIRCRDVELSSELSAAIKAASRGSARLIVNNLDTVRQRARVLGKAELDLSDLGTVRLHDGTAPELRRFA